MSSNSSDSPHAVPLDAAGFEQALRTDRPVLVDFHAAWCPPCRVLGPTIDALADAYAERVTVGTLDVDAHADLAARYDVRSIPTVVIFEDGAPSTRFVGLTAKDDLARAIDDALARSAA